MTFATFFAKIDQSFDLTNILKERVRVVADGHWAEEEDYNLPIVNIDIFWSYFSGLNISFRKDRENYFTVNCREQEVYNPSNNLFMTKEDKFTKKFAQEMANYVEFKTRDIYRELLKNSKGNIHTRSVNFPDVDCHPLTHTDDKFISQSPLIPVVLENHVDILSIPIQRRVVEPESLETTEDTEHGTLFSDITRPRTMFTRGFEGVNKLLMANYVKIFEVLRNHGDITQDMPNVWLVAGDQDIQLVIEFEPDFGFQFIVTQNKRVVMSINTERSFTPVGIQNGLEECIRAELEYHSAEYLSHAFETAVRDITRVFKKTGCASAGDAGIVSWEVITRDTVEPDMFGRDIAQNDGNDFNYDDAHSRGSASGDSDDDITGDLDSFARIMEEVNAFARDDEDNGISSDDDDDDNGISGDDEDNDNDDNGDSSDDDDDEYDTELNVRIKLPGGSHYFWELQSDDSHKFRTTSFGLLLCIMKQLDTKAPQEVVAFDILRKIEQIYSSPKQKKRDYQALINGVSVSIVYLPKVLDIIRVKVAIDFRKIEIQINESDKTVSFTGLLRDVIFDRLIGSWSPFSGECIVCTEPGGFRTSCCGQVFHGGCAQKWCEISAKNRTSATCPMCRSDRFA